MRRARALSPRLKLVPAVVSSFLCRQARRAASRAARPDIAPCPCGKSTSAPNAVSSEFRLPPRPKARGRNIRARDRRTRIPLRRSTDRKSTRLNSSHLGISYAVFCLKKKKEDLYHIHIGIELIL